MRKIFVLDTNVLIHNPNALFAFDEHDIAIPLMVIEELDRFKGYTDERGRAARQAARWLDKLRNEGSLIDGVKLQDGGILSVITIDPEDFPVGLDRTKPDNIILATALNLTHKHKDARVTFVSLDLNARIKASALQIHTEDFLTDKVRIDELYTGYQELTVAEDILDLFIKNRVLTAKEAPFLEHALANEFFSLQGENPGKGKTVAGRWLAETGQLVALAHQHTRPMGLEPLNLEQKFALELLLDEKIQLVSLLGKAGTGKTLLALAAALKKSLDDKVYRKITVARPVIPMGKDIGYLPGTKDEKMFHWMRPVFDNLEFIFMQTLDDIQEAEKSIHSLIERGKIEIEALTYIRGRSLSKDYFIIDESQNLTPHEVKTIVSRAGQGTKVVLTGDIYQIDNPYLDSSSNGLTHCVEKFKNQPIFGCVTLSRAERSVLSDLAARLL